MLVAIHKNNDVMKHTNPPSSVAADSDAVTRSQFLDLFTAVFLPMFMAAVDQTLLATATPTIAATLGGLTDTSWIAVAYLLASASVVPLYGRLGDQRGRRQMLMLAVGIFSIGSLACGIAQSLPQLIAARVVQGLGGAGLMTLSQALIGELIAPRERVRYQAYFAMVFTLASVTGPVVGGIVVSHFSWRWLFLANLPLAAFALWKLRQLPVGAIHPAARGTHDFAGIVLFALSTVTGLYWLTSGGHHFTWLSVQSLALLSVSAITLIVLVLRERTHLSPFIPVDLLRDKTILLSLITTLVFASCMFALVFFLPIYLQLGHKVSAMHSGLLLLPLTAGMVVGSLMAGRFVSRTGRAKWVPVSGMVLASAALFTLGVLAPRTTLVGALGFVAGLGLGVIMPINQVVVQTVAGRARLGAVTSMISLFRSVGGAAGAAVFGAVVYSLMPEVEHTALSSSAEASAPVIRSFHIAFMMAASIAAIGALVASRIPQVPLWQPVATKRPDEILATDGPGIT
ncbi:MAG: major facilitator superfamily 1 [Betaproteobacteria bacterium]|nr:major facilitator superfamily 1 [Betaproteobacteria bacterium]